MVERRRFGGGSVAIAQSVVPDKHCKAHCMVMVDENSVQVLIWASEEEALVRQ